MDQETQRELKRIELEIGRLRKEDRLLRERISVASGDYSVDFFRQGSLSGTLSAGNGISGGGTFPGSVSIAIDLASPSGLEFSSGQLQVIDAIAGSGLTISSKILAVGAGSGITVNANDVALTTPGNVTVSSSNDPTGNHTHAATSSSNPGAAQYLLASDASGYLQLVRIGAGMAPTYPVTASGYMYSEGDGSASGYLSYRYSGDATAPYWSSRKARGSVASPAIVQDNDFIWQMNVQGYDGSAWANAANILFRINGTPGSGDMPTEFDLRLSPSGSATPETALLIEADKHMYVKGEATLETRCFGFLKAQNQDGKVGNGPVEYGEVAAVCGVMEIAPGGALYEAVTIN